MAFLIHTLINTQGEWFANSFGHYYLARGKKICIHKVLNLGANKIS
jgi:hypothetical protein